jgi:2-dehydro-3-deoxyglucarate aldolase/4-hydroxy-2-oxoheptanedioate aldolase
MSLKHRLNTGRLVLSTMVGELRGASVPYLLKAGGLDSFIIDMEHGTHSWSDMAGLILTGKAVGLSPIVRIPEVRRETVMKPFDAGAAGILVPMIESAEQVAEIVRWAKYPPDGARGVSIRRGHNGFVAGPMTEQVARGNAETAVIVQIETVTAVEAVEPIVAVPGLDAVFIGPNDLSIAAGRPGELHSDAMTAMYDRVIGAALDAGVAAGFQASTPAEAADVVARGVRFVSYSTDTSALIDKAAEVSRALRPVPDPA